MKILLLIAFTAAFPASWQKLSITGTIPGSIAWTTACYVNSWKKIFIFGNGASTSENQAPCYLSKYTGGLGYYNTEHSFDYATRVWTMLRDDHDVTNYESYIETRRMNDAMPWPASWPAEPPGRDNHQMVYDPILDKVYMLGGTCHGDFWMYDVQPRKWYLLSTKGLYTDLPLLPSTDTYYKGVSAIGQVFNCAMVFDYLNRRVIIHGGRLATNCPGYDRTYAFDCTNPQATQRWVRIAQDSPVKAPAMEAGENNAVYDPVNQKMIYFGGGEGWCGETKTGVTWELDCVTDTWSKWSPNPSPPPRYFPCFVYDPYHRKAFLHGGDCGGTDTWAYDPQARTWEHIANGPQNVRFSVGGYDLENRRFVLYTGSGGNETWAMTYEDGPEYAPVPYPSAVESKGGQALRPAPVFIASPNPFRAFTALRTGGRIAGTIDVFDIRARKVATLRLAEGNAMWDGKDGLGRALPSGIYTASFGKAGQRVRVRLILLK